VAFDILIKPKFDGQGGGGVVTSQPGTLVVYSPDGEVLDTVQVGGAKGSEGYKQSVNSIAKGLPAGSTIEFTPQGGTPTVYNLTQYGQRHEFSFGNPEPTVVSGKGAVGSVGGGGGGASYPGQFEPGSAGGYGAYPGYLGGEFPTPSLVDYDPINAAEYNFTDPIDFAKAFGSFNREELLKNFDQSKKFALDTLQTELQGLEGFVPAASALKRKETALDNIFNQQQRTDQINKVLPEARGQLDAQGQRAETYAQGRVPDSVTDAALELGVRSDAADLASAGGFGSTSSVARKTSDLMSAKERIALSQYGDQALTSNIGTKANLFLAPTSYSDAGQQIRVTPEVGAGRLTSQGFSELNANTLISPGAALSAEINQQQFSTNINQRTNEFNAGNQFSANQINAGYENQFKLGKFGYDVDFAGIVAGAHQTDINTTIALEQQEQAHDTFNEHEDNAQQSDQTGAIFEAGGQIVAAIFGGYSGGSEGGGGGGLLNTDGSQPNTSPLTAEQVGDVGITRDSNASNLAQDPRANALTREAGGELPYTPDIGFQTNYNVFRDATNAPLVTSQAQEQQLNQFSGTILSNVGISDTPKKGYVATGIDNAGNPVYSSVALAQSNDGAAGSNVVNTLGRVLSPLNIFNDADVSAMQKISTASSNPALTADLETKVQEGDRKGFISTMLGALDISSKDRNDSAFAASELYSNWDSMSPAQQSLSISSLGLKSYRDAEGRSLGQKPVVEAQGNTPGLSTSQALQLFSKGYNVYTLANNWKDFNDFAKVAGADNNPESTAALAQQFGMLGAGTQGAAANTKDTVFSDGSFASGTSPPPSGARPAPAGAQPAPAAGPGAITLPAGSKLPNGYVQMGMDVAGKIILAVPEKNRGQVVIGMLGAGATGTAVIGAAAFGAGKGAQKVMKQWKESLSNPTPRNVVGGSAIAAGLGSVAFTAPFLLGGAMVTNTIGGMFGGKSKDQGKRDSVRSNFKKLGGVDNDWNVTLSNGNKVNVGVDGRGGMDGDRHAYDLDYKNDLSFATGMGGIALSRLVSGGKSTEADQVGSQFANAALSELSNKDFTEANYNTAMQNMRAIYAQSGIKSKEEAYQLANQAFAEGRLSDFDLVQAQQAANMIYDPGSFSTAQKLMSGRNRGVEVAEGQSSNSTRIEPTNTPGINRNSSAPNRRQARRASRNLLSKEDRAALNASRYGSAAA